MNTTRMDRSDFVSAIVLIVFALGVVIESLRMDRLEKLDVSGYTVPGLVPGMIGGLLLACGIVLLVRSVARGGWRIGVGRATVAGVLESRSVRRVGLTLLLTFGFALGLFGWLPFGPAAAIFVLAFIMLLGDRRFATRSAWLKHAGVGLVIAIVAGYGIEFVFAEVFLVRLP